MVSLEQPTSELTCFGKCIKVLLYVFNVLFLSSGIAALGVAIWVLRDDSSERIIVMLNSELYVVASFMLIAAGSLAVLVSFLGCCGARYENRCFLVMYAAFLLLIFVAEFAAGVIALALYTQVETLANTEMRDSVIEKYGQVNQEDATDAWNYMQSSFDCCGFIGDGHDAAQLYQISRWYDDSMIKVPPSCCTRDDDGEPINLESCQDDLLDNKMTYVNNVGCQPAVVEVTIGYTTALAGTGIGLSLLQLIGLILAFCLFRQI